MVTGEGEIKYLIEEMSPSRSRNFRKPKIIGKRDSTELISLIIMQKYLNCKYLFLSENPFDWGRGEEGVELGVVHTFVVVDNCGASKMERLRELYESRFFHLIDTITK